MLACVSPFKIKTARLREPSYEIRNRRHSDEDTILDHDGGGDGRRGDWLDRHRLRPWRPRWWRRRRLRRWRRCSRRRRILRWSAAVGRKFSVVQPTVSACGETGDSTIRARCTACDSSGAAERRSRVATECWWWKHRCRKSSVNSTGKSAEHRLRWCIASLDVARHSAGRRLWHWVRTRDRFGSGHSESPRRGTRNCESPWCRTRDCQSTGCLTASGESTSGTRCCRRRGSIGRCSRAGPHGESAGLRRSPIQPQRPHVEWP